MCQSCIDNIHTFIWVNKTSSCDLVSRVVYPVGGSRPPTLFRLTAPGSFLFRRPSSTLTVTAEECYAQEINITSCCG